MQGLKDVLQGSVVCGQHILRQKDEHIARCAACGTIPGSSVIEIIAGY
jgi:formate dehydrogenase maturation protein FdhE